VVIFGIMGICGCSIVFFFWHIWKAPRHEEIDNPDYKIGLEVPMTLTWREKIWEWKRVVMMKAKRPRTEDVKAESAGQV